MPEIQLNIPAIGEGLQEARVVALLKQPGDTIARDEAIYQMETDKAVMDVESSVSGRVVRWLAAPDDVLSIGAPILVVETSEEVPVEVVAESATPVPVAASSGGDGIVSLRIPAIGEGLQEARLVAVLKNVGEAVKRDDAVYQIETDKAVMDVECPYEGEVVEWLANVDDVLPIGAEVARFRTSDAVSSDSGVAESAPASVSPSSAPTAAAPAVAGSRRRDVPPRTRAYAKEKGVSNDQLETIPTKGSKLMPEDIDAFLAGGSSAAPAAPARGKNYSEQAMGGKQRVLASRLQRSNQIVVPGMMSIVTDWGKIEALRDEQKAKGGDFQPSAFTYFAYAVAKAAPGHPIMRSTMVGDSTIRTYDHLQLGIAVALPGDELVVAVVRDSDTLNWADFAGEARARINDAREGKDQANESVTLSITNMAGHGIREAMAVVVPPGVATIFLGEAYNGLANDVPGEFKVMRCANVGITIDHRLINGVGGAEFLNAIRDNIANIRELCS